MPTAASFERERKELDAILASGIFNRAPNLAHLLKYVCSKYFEGASGDIKEYNIAIEALGRAPEFDQKRDSIVRVEAHRLRKRLREYYEREGLNHEIHIDIPSGQYTPRFVITAISEPEVSSKPDEYFPARLETAVISDSVPAIATTPCDDSGPKAELPQRSLVGVVPLPAVFDAKGSGPRSSRPWVTAIVLLSVTFAGLVIITERERVASPVRLPTPIGTLDSSGDVRILAGVESGSYVDAFERTWQSDRFYTGGYISQTPRMRPVTGTRDPRIYQSRREGVFRYDIPLAPGSYELKLYFAETVFGDNNVAGGGETTRIFDVNVNGRQLLPAFDVINDAGSAIADIKLFKDISPATDGKLHLEFSPETNPAFVNAIELVRNLPGKMLAIRIVARDRGIKDSQNRYWDPDRYAQGGQVISRPEANVVSAEPELYRSERFGNLRYTIPVAQQGRYGVTMYFAENWFGPGNPGGGGIGSRIFDIFVNGVVVRRNFDIFREAGGVGHASTLALHRVEPNHQGKIVIALTPARNYACINALEIVDESR
jgi:hypothetical protein